MLKSTVESRAHSLIRRFPERIGAELFRVLRGRRCGFEELREIRVRAGGRCSVTVGEENIPLFESVSPDECELFVRELCDGALYAHRDSIASGYITLDGGVRVGICGFARYDDDRLVGVSDTRSLVFRFPGGKCEFGENIYAIWQQGVGSGMLIYSPPGVGKTTALRSLARSIGGDRHPQHVCVVDERCEFSEEDYMGCEVDILKGYKRRAGLEIATRTMSAEVVMIDEIGGDDAREIYDIVRCGIPLIATAHADSYEELLCKGSIAPLIDAGAFDVFVGIKRVGGAYSLTVDRR